MKFYSLLVTAAACMDALTIFFLLFAFVEHHSTGVRGTQGGEHKVFKNRAKREMRGKMELGCMSVCNAWSRIEQWGGRTDKKNRDFQGTMGWVLLVLLCGCTPKPTATTMMLVIITKKSTRLSYPQPYGVLGAIAVGGREHVAN